MKSKKLKRQNRAARRAAKPSKQKTPKLKRQQSLWSIIKATLGEFKRHWGAYMLMAAVVFVPSAIIRQFTASSSSGNDYSIALYLADLFAVLALFWRAQGRGAGSSQGGADTASSSPKIRDIYVASSRRYLPFLLIAVLLAVILVPFALGFLLIFLTTAAGLAAYYLIGGFLIIAVCLFIIVRLSLAIVAVVDEQMTWRSAIRTSWRLTRRQWWHLALSYLTYFVVAALLAGAILSLFGHIPAIGRNSIAIGVVNGLLLAVTIPILTIYATNLFVNLQSSQAQMTSGNDQGAS